MTGGGGLGEMSYSARPGSGAECRADEGFAAVCMQARANTRQSRLSCPRGWAAHFKAVFTHTGGEDIYEYKKVTPLKSSRRYSHRRINILSPACIYSSSTSHCGENWLWIFLAIVPLREKIRSKRELREIVRLVRPMEKFLPCATTRARLFGGVSQFRTFSDGKQERD